MNMILYIIAGPLFIVSAVAHIYIKITMRPQPKDELEEFYYEEFHEGRDKYSKLTKLTFAGMTLAILLIFIATYI